MNIALRVCLVSMIVLGAVLAQSLPPVVVNPDGFRAAPTYLIGGGVGFNKYSAPQANGWLTFGRKIQEGTYVTGTTDLTGKTNSVRAGIEQIFLQVGPLVLTAKADAGMATANASNLGGAFAGGGSILLDISKLAKAPGAYLVGSVRALKTSLAEVEPVFYFGVIKTF